MLLDKPLESHPLEPNVELPPPSMLKRKIIIKNKKKHHHHHHHHHKKSTQNNTLNNSNTGTSIQPPSDWEYIDLSNFSFGFLLLFTYRNETIGNSNTQPSSIPPTIDEESTNVTTGNGDAVHHAPMLQVSNTQRADSIISFNLENVTSEKTGIKLSLSVWSGLDSYPVYLPLFSIHWNEFRNVFVPKLQRPSKLNETAFKTSEFRIYTYFNGADRIRNGNDVTNSENVCDTKMNYFS